MKIIANKKTTNKIIIAIILVVTLNFATPNYTKAFDFGDLFDPIAELLCSIGDLAIKFLQKSFIGTGTIKDIGTQGGDTYHIYYGPKNIFSGAIPVFDINFINPSDNNTIKLKIYDTEYVLNKTAIEMNGGNLIRSYTYSSTSDAMLGIFDLHPFVTKNNALKYFKNGKKIVSEGDFKSYDVYSSDRDVTEYVRSDKEVIGCVTDMASKYFSTGTVTMTTDAIKCAWTDESEDKLYIITDCNIYMETQSTDQNGELVEHYTDNDILALYVLPLNGDLLVKAEELKGILGDNYTFENEKTYTVVNSAQILQPIIAKWYINLRTIALVGLLSVLVYVGIRMIISSTGQEKAKYKNMIKDWIVAICILFILQFIMVFIIEISQDITRIITGDPPEILQEDTLMSNVRASVGEGSFTETFANMIIYLVLVIFTCIFTFQYLKRVVYMAFLTTISPLIALTYPLDKIKDGQAQAFSMWIKEYVFNALLQVMHILLYTMLVDSSTTLLEEGHWLYAIVAIGFLVPAEKFFRKMFGFEKAGTISPIGAAASGALIMNAMNKMKAGGSSKGGGDKESEGSDSGSKPPDTSKGGGDNKMDSPTEAWSNTTSVATETPKSTSADDPASGGGTPAPTGDSDNTDGNNDPGEQSRFDRLKQFASDRIAKPIKDNIVTPYRNSNVIKGVRAVRKKRFTGKKIAKFLGKKALQVGMGATLGTIGLAAGIATGDPSKAFTYATGGAAAGAAVAAGTVNRIESGVKNVKKDIETFRQGYLGTDYQKYASQKADKQFMNDNENQLYYNTQFEDGKQAMQDALIARHNGITDNKEIAKILKMAYKGMNPNATEEERKNNVRRMVGIAQLSNQITNDQYNNNDARQDFSNRLIEKLKSEGLTDDEASGKAKEIIEKIGEYKGINI